MHVCMCLLWARVAAVGEREDMKKNKRSKYKVAVFTTGYFGSGLISLVPNLVPLVSNDLVQPSK